MGIRFGIDIGIASVGVAVVDDEYNVLESVVNIFESADASKNGERRSFRQGKRLLRRKKNRLRDFDVLCIKYGLTIPETIHQNVLQIRVKGIKEKLTWNELYFVLRYMLKHRGISYLEDVEIGNGGSSYLEALANNSKELENKYPCQIQYERLKNHNQFRGENVVDINGNKAHISNVFTSSSYRNELIAIIEHQRELVDSIGKGFVEEYLAIWSRKREYYHGPGNEKSRTDYGRFTTKKDENGLYITEENIFEKLIGKCSVYKDERRAAGASYTAQEFNLLNDLNNLNINGRKLDKEEKEQIVCQVKEADTVNMRKIIKKVIGEEIESLSGARKDKDDKEEFHKFEQYNKIRKELAKKSISIEKFTIEELDTIAEILTLNTDREAIEKSFTLHDVKLTDEEKEVLIEIRKKNGSMFSKWQSLSIKIMRELIPDLYSRPVNQMVLLTEMGVFKGKNELYNQCKEIPVDTILEEIYNPVVKRSIRIAVKVMNALIRKYGNPDEIIIEMPRDKNSDEQKKRIKEQQKKNEKEIEDIISRVNSEYGIKITDEHFRNHKHLRMKLKLWSEQEGVCLYSGKPIHIRELIDEQNMFEIDHIIPKSISYDDSRSNKVLVLRGENQDKKNSTPYKYLSTVNREWDFHEFMSRVLELKNKKKLSAAKVNNLLFMEDITKIDVLKGFVSRNINDTRYASRTVLNILQDYFKAKELPTKIRVIKGSFTHELRNALKLDKDREESFAHHGVDAMIMCYSQMGLNTYNQLKETIIDFDKEIILNEQKWNEVFCDKQYDECMYQNKLFTIKKNIAIAEKKIKYNHMVDKKYNRTICNATIYGTREYEGKVYKIRSLDIRTDDGIKRLKKLIDGKKLDNVLMKRNDPVTFENLMKIYTMYRDAKNPFIEYEKSGEKVRKYAKNGQGCIVKRIKYVDGEVNACVDISHKYGFAKNSKKVIMDSLNPYRTDVYFNAKDSTYYLVGIKYSHYKFDKGKYILDESQYEKLLIEEGVLKENEKYQQLDELGIEFKFSLYKNDIIYYEKNGEMYKERFLSRTKPQARNYVETKPVDSPKYSKQNLVGLSRTKLIRKIHTDILGNEYWCDKEKFKIVLE